MTASQSILIIGVGSIGERHLRCFQSCQNVSLAICEINPQLRQEVAERYNITTTYADLTEALNDEHFAAVIAVPANLHIELANQAAEAGLHLLIEKPLSTNFEGIADLATVVHEKNLIACVAYVYRANPALAVLREKIQSGEFGKPVQIVVSGGQHFPTYRPAYRDTYYRDHATGGGAIQDALTHLVNAVEWLVGPVICVAADAAHQMLADVDVEDTVHVIARHRISSHDEVPACYNLNQYQAPNETSITVNCQKGTLRYESIPLRCRWMTIPEGPWQEEEFSYVERDTLFMEQCRAFLKAIENKGPVLCTLDEGIQTLAVNLAILAAVKEQSWKKPCIDLAGIFQK